MEAEIHLPSVYAQHPHLERRRVRTRIQPVHGAVILEKFPEIHTVTQETFFFLQRRFCDRIHHRFRRHPAAIGTEGVPDLLPIGARKRRYALSADRHDAFSGEIGDRFGEFRIDPLAERKFHIGLFGHQRHIFRRTEKRIHRVFDGGKSRFGRRGVLSENRDLLRPAFFLPLGKRFQLLVRRRKPVEIFLP